MGSIIPQLKDTADVNRWTSLRSFSTALTGFPGLSSGATPFSPIHNSMKLNSLTLHTDHFALTLVAVISSSDLVRGKQVKKEIYGPEVIKEYIPAIVNDNLTATAVCIKAWLDKQIITGMYLPSRPKTFL